MNDTSQETLLRVEHNDDSLKNLVINTVQGFDFNRLGRAIATNTHLKSFYINLSELALNVTNTEFYDGLKQNTSIERLIIECSDHRHGLRHRTVGGKIMQAYQENNNQLKKITIRHVANLHNEGANEVATALQCCSNLRFINLFNCNITPEQLLPIVEAARQRTSLQLMSLGHNRIGNDGCETLATLLEDPNCNITTLHVNSNNISNEGAFALANSFVNNTKLQDLDISSNPFDITGVWLLFKNVLCNTSSINDTYSSNHTLQTLRLTIREATSHILQLNKSSNKTHVAIKKILQYHHDIGVESLFGLDKDGEWTLKALPYVVAWFERASAVKVSDSAFVQESERDRTIRRSLSSIYKFAKAMPLLFVSSDHVKTDKKKRKRVN